MKKLTLNAPGSARPHKICVSNKTSKILKTSTMFLTVLILSISACKQEKTPLTEPGTVSGKSSGKTSAQPLPGGKARFSWLSGNFDNSSYTWVRMTNLTFNATAGTVGATVYIWRSDQNKNKEVFLSHRCTFRGYTKFCDVYTPGGWTYPAGQYTSWSGTYTYNTTTGVLNISWTSGVTATESWQITNPTPYLARAAKISSSYGTTHGRGYGSNASWSTFKTVVGTGFPTYGTDYSREVWASHSAPTTVASLSAGAASGDWIISAKSFAGFTTATGVTAPATVAHYDLTTYQCSASSCATSRLGKLYHLASLNTNRSMVYNMFCACLPQDNAIFQDGTEFPCYPRRMHPFAIQQIIDDNGDLVAMIAIEASHTFATDPGSLLSLNDWNNIP